MMTMKIGFVAGFGRCGTSLVMAMLAAGGLKTVGAAPLFEHPQYIAWRTDFGFLRRQNGKVIKWVDPIVPIIPHDVVGPVLWLDRDMTEQAKSQIKMANAFGENWPVDAAKIAEVEGQIHTKRNTAMAHAATVGPVSVLTFEELLFDPVRSAKILREVFQTFGNLDIEAASSVVRSRSPHCASEMEMTRSEAIASLEEAARYGRS